MREKKFYFAVLIGAAVLIIGAQSAFAQGRGRQMGRKHWEKIEMLRIWKLADVLEMNEDEMAKIIPAIRTYHAALRDKADERESVIRGIRLELRKKEGIDSKKIIESVKKSTDLEAEVVKIRQAHYREMEKFLTPEQMGKYLVFEIRFHDEIRNWMQGMGRGRGRGGPGMRGQGPPAAGDDAPTPLPEEKD